MSASTVDGEIDFMNREVVEGDYGFGSDRPRVSVNAANGLQGSAFGGHGQHAHRPYLVLLQQVLKRLPTTEVRHGDA